MVGEPEEETRVEHVSTSSRLSVVVCPSWLLRSAGYKRRQRRRRGLYAVNTRPSQPGFSRLAINAVNYKTRCSLPQQSCFCSAAPFLLSFLTKPVHSRPSSSPLYPLNRQSTTIDCRDGPYQERFAQHDHSGDFDLYPSQNERPVAGRPQGLQASRLDHLFPEEA